MTLRNIKNMMLHVGCQEDFLFSLHFVPTHKAQMQSRRCGYSPRLTSLGADLPISSFMFAVHLLLL